MFLRIFYVFILAAICFWIPSAYKRWTHGVRLAKCSLSLEYQPNWDTGPLKDEGLKNVLSQPFSYMDKGAQSYVFLSQDQKYVLKLFRFTTCRMPFIQKWIRKTRALLHLREKHFLENSVKIQKTFTSCKLCYSKIPHLTGVVWVHLNLQNSDLPIITVHDRLGRALKVDPQKFRFVLQKKANPLRSTLIKTTNPSELINSYLALLDHLSQLGIANLDRTMGKNFGFLEDQAIATDIGNFVEDKTLAETDVAYFTSELFQWLKKHHL